MLECAWRTLPGNALSRETAGVQTRLNSNVLDVPLVTRGCDAHNSGVGGFRISESPEEPAFFAVAAAVEHAGNEAHGYDNAYQVHELERAITAVRRDSKDAFDKVHAASRASRIVADPARATHK